MIVTGMSNAWEQAIKRLCVFLPNLFGLKLRMTEGLNVNALKPIIWLIFTVCSVVLLGTRHLIVLQTLMGYQLSAKH